MSMALQTLTADLRSEAPACRKRRYSKGAAKLVLRRMRSGAQVIDQAHLQAYQCGCCGDWHLGHALSRDELRKQVWRPPTVQTRRDDL